MKTEFVDVNETRKNVRVEIPTDVVNAEIDRIARDYSRKARVPGFRPGKAPARVIKQRFKDQILHDVAHDLIPRAMDDALREMIITRKPLDDLRTYCFSHGMKSLRQEGMEHALSGRTSLEEVLKVTAED